MSGVSASLRPTSLGAAGSLADEVGFDLFLENILSYPAEKIGRAPEKVRHNTNTSANRLTDGEQVIKLSPNHHTHTTVPAYLFVNPQPSWFGLKAMSPLCMESLDMEATRRPIRRWAARMGARTTSLAKRSAMVSEDAVLKAMSTSRPPLKRAKDSNQFLSNFQQRRDVRCNLV